MTRGSDAGWSFVSPAFGVGVDEVQGWALFAEVFEDGPGGAARDVGEIHQLGDGRQGAVSDPLLECERRVNPLARPRERREPRANMAR